MTRSSAKTALWHVHSLSKGWSLFVRRISEAISLLSAIHLPLLSKMRDICTAAPFIPRKSWKRKSPRQCSELFYSITSTKNIISPATRWRSGVYLKGAKKIPRRTKEGHEYVFSEGPIAFPDPWDRPGRTMLTSESTLNRSTHTVVDPGTGRIRLLTPVEAERLQGFDDDWTAGMPDRMRYFCMGNALVVPMITRMGHVLDDIIADEE